MNYEKDMKIDEDALDIEWLEQPSLMLKYIKLQTQLQKEEELAKEKFELLKAELDKKIRSNPEKFELAKITDSVVQYTILLQNDYTNANIIYIDAKFENNVAKGAVRAMDIRKQSLENLVKLHGQGYFAGPKIPRNLTWEREERQKRVDKNVSEKLRRRNK